MCIRDSPYASHGGLTYLITGLHPEAERDHGA